MRSFAEIYRTAIRHLDKIRAVRANAAFLRKQSQHSAGFDRYLANWASEHRESE